MANNKTITVNGRVYDAISGLPAKKPLPRPVSALPSKPAGPSATPARRPATDIHSQLERSKTLRRSAVPKPAVTPKHPTRGRTMDVAMSSRISRFAPHPVTKPAAKVASASPMKLPQIHPVAERALTRQAPIATNKPAAPKTLTSQEIKNSAIAAALDAPKPAKKKRAFARWKKRTVIIVAVLLAVAGTAYGVYRFVPAVSVSVASTQAGVSAKYPDYVPDGFSLHHPVTYSPGEVVLTFASNSNDDSYTITQTKSSWNSDAVLDNVVKKAVGDDYSATKERGLTIYTYGKNASWANGGILYTITSNAHLSNEQIRRIATSL